MGQIKTISGNELLEKAAPEYSLVVKEALEPMRSSIQILRNSPSIQTDVTPLKNTLLTKSVQEQQELENTVSDLDVALTKLQETFKEDTIEEVQSRGLSYSGSFKGKFEGDGSKLKNLRWESIIGKKNRPGAGGAVFSALSAAASSSVSGTVGTLAKFVGDNVIGDSIITESGSLIQIDGDITVSGSIIARGMVLAIVTKTANYTATLADHTILGNASGSSFTVTLPPDAPVGFILHVKKIDSSANVVTVDGNGADIDRDPDVPISRQDEALKFQLDESFNWRVL